MSTGKVIHRQSTEVGKKTEAFITSSPNKYMEKKWLGCGLTA